MAREQGHFTSVVRNSSHRRTSRTHLNEAGSQQQTENMLMVHSHVRLFSRSKYPNSYVHLFLPGNCLWVHVSDSKSWMKNAKMPLPQTIRRLSTTPVRKSSTLADESFQI